MKIVFLTKSVSNKAGGLLIVMQRIGFEISRQRGDTLVAMGIEDSAVKANDIEWGPSYVQAFKHKGPHSLGYSPHMIKALAETRPDIVHTHGLFHYTSVVACQWGESSGRPYVVSPHGMIDPWALRNAHWKKLLAGWLFENKHLSHARCIHALCGSESKSIRAYGLKNPICQIPNGIDLPKDSDCYPPPWPGAGTAGKGKKALLYLGRIHPKKGLFNLLVAWSGALKDHSVAHEWILVIAGWDQGGHEGELKALSKKIGLKDNIRFLGPQFGRDKAACYQNANGFILPSYSEGLPMVILEAWAYGLPVLMTPQCNLPEGFSADAAIKIQAEPKAIQRALRDFFQLSEKGRIAMGLRGRKLVEKKFTWEKAAKDMVAVYQWVLGGGSPPSCVITN